MEDIGERKAIDEIKTLFSDSHLPIDIGDDCGVFQLHDLYILVSTDMITEHTHIPSQMSPWDIGWFIVAINLSDIAAKGGIPKGIVLSCGLPKTYQLSDLIKFMKGVKACTQEYKTPLLGGDTKENHHLTISGTAIGTVSPQEFMSRKGAMVNDIVMVTGTIGKAAAGYQDLISKHDSILHSNPLIHPLPRLDAGLMLASTKKIHCCMDLSDGLSSSLYQLAELNGVGFEITEEDLPISSLLSDVTADQSAQETIEKVLHFGGDYELLFTLEENDFEEVHHLLHSHHMVVTPIGKVTKKQKITLNTSSEQKIISNKGYEHFKTHTTSHGQ